MPGGSAESGITVLHVLSWLNYGGVERYALRLGSALQRRGHRVLIASSGGRLLPELEAAGLEHRHVDFTGRHMLSGMLRLRRLLEEEHVDLVNAHNWRAGLVSYLACRRAGVPYLLTIHGTRRPLLRRSVFYWSKRVVVVSEASRRNLVEGFGLPEERVVLSSIGVDCEEFHPALPDGQLEGELGLQPGAPRVLHISRFSQSKAPVAFTLIASMPRLTQTAPNVELVLAGDGPEQAAVARQAEEMNRRLERRAVVVVEARPDVSRLILLAEVVVGTATVALEAMACGKAVIAAGKGGYLGAVTPDRAGLAEESCYADHQTLAPLDRGTLAGELARLLTHPEERERLAAFGLETAQSRHAVSRVAEEMERVYLRELCDRDQVKRIAVFHLNQIGDLMFTLPALKALRETFPSAHITSVLRPHLAGLVSHSGFVDELVRRPPGGPLSAVKLGLELRKREPDLAITLSQSATMALSAWLSRAPHRIGYIDSDLCRLLNHRVQVRGIPCPAKVLRLLGALGVPARQRHYVGLVHLSPQDEAQGERLLAGCRLVGAGPVIALAPGEAGGRPYKSWSADGFRQVAQRLVETHDARLVVVGGASDQSLADQIVAGIGDHGCNLAGRTSPAELAAVLARCDLLIGIDSGPMHVAAAMGKPAVALFGPTDPSRTGPMGERHEVIFHRQDCWRPCIHPMIPKACDRRCMAAITVEEVVAAAESVIARLSGKAERPEGSRAVHRPR